jgi:hypothetical protein
MIAFGVFNPAKLINHAMHEIPQKRQFLKITKAQVVPFPKWCSCLPFDFSNISRGLINYKK